MIREQWRTTGNRLVVPAFGLALAVAAWGISEYLSTWFAAGGMTPGMLPALLLFGFLGCVLIVLKPQIGLYAIALWIPLQYYFTTHLGLLPEAAKWLDDAIVMLLVLIAVTRLLPRLQLPLTPMLPGFALFIGLACVSAAVNQVPLGTTVAGLRSQLMYPLFFLSIVMLDFSDKALKTFLWISTLLALIQLPVSMIQFLQGGVGTFNPDIVYGTFAQGWANLLGHYLLIFVLIFAGLLIEFPLRRRLHVLIVCCLIVTIILTAGRAALVFLALGLLLVFGKRLLNPRVFIAAAIVTLAIVITISQYYGARRGTFWVDFRPQYLLAEQQNNAISPGRLYYIGYTWELIQQDPLRFLVGFGPGTYASTAGAALRAPLLLQATRNAYSPTIQSQVVAILGEYGVLGTLTLWGMFIAMWWWVIWKARWAFPPFWRGIAHGVVVASFIYIFLGVWVEKLWETQPLPYYYWFLAGALFVTARRGSLKPCS